MRINLISGPRNVSTALMYSFAQRSDTLVIDEPLYACYLKKTGVDHPGKDEILASQRTNKTEIIKHVIFGEYEQPVVFIKNMAHHLADLDTGFLERLINLFLIRDPEEMLPSLIRQIPEPVMRDTAYRDQWELFSTLSEQGNRPLVIDSKQLLLNPPDVLSQLCERVGIRFEKNMLSWQPGPIPEDGVWAKHWYDNVHRSAGFKPYAEKEEEVPERLQGLLEECVSYYNKLNPHSIKANSDGRRET